MSGTLRLHWNREPTRLRELLIVRKEPDSKSFDAICHLRTHVFGWEMRLEINGDLQRSECVGLRTPVFMTGELWKKTRTEKGWR